jgi:hypothetical protein
MRQISPSSACLTSGIHVGLVDFCSTREGRHDEAADPVVDLAGTAGGADLVTQDATINSLGVSMNDLLTLANDSPARSVTILLDCCFSGDAGSPLGLQSRGVAEGFRLRRGRPADPPATDRTSPASRRSCRLTPDPPAVPSSEPETRALAGAWDSGGPGFDGARVSSRSWSSRSSRSVSTMTVGVLHRRVARDLAVQRRPIGHAVGAGLVPPICKTLPGVGFWSSPVLCRTAVTVSRVENTSHLMRPSSGTRPGCSGDRPG